MDSRVRRQIWVRDFGIVISLVDHEYNGSMYICYGFTKQHGVTTYKLQYFEIWLNSPEISFLWTRSTHHVLLFVMAGAPFVSRSGHWIYTLTFSGHSPVPPWTWQDIVRLHRCKKGISVEWRIDLYRTLLKCQPHCSRKKSVTWRCTSLHSYSRNYLWLVSRPGRFIPRK